MPGHESFNRLIEQQRMATQRAPGMHVEEEIIRARNEKYLLEVLQWNKAYDARADARREAYFADRFSGAVCTLFGRL